VHSRDQLDSAAGESSLSAHYLAALDNHGERMVPECADHFTFWEHVYRYAFACRLARGKRVLDIACGEGYGAAALQRAGASSVVGVDISADICRHARERYGIDARPGPAESIPLPDESVDVVVSFETIEHVPDPLRFLDECARVLVPGGRLIVSTPNKNVYRWPGGVQNPHHCSEMTEDEFIPALARRFRGIRLYTQRPISAAWWDLRRLATETKPEARGIERLRRSAQFRLFPRAVCEPTLEERASVVDLILSTNRARGPNPLNGYVLRPRRRFQKGQALYLTALATCKG
jgi:SAM-dependent methyltransferase